MTPKLYVGEIEGVRVPDLNGEPSLELNVEGELIVEYISSFIEDCLPEVGTYVRIVVMSFPTEEVDIAGSID